MPFTLSHAAAVLPLVTGRPARRLVPCALVIGSWVPDLPYFVPPHRGSDWSHAASGPVTIDLVLGLLVVLLWREVLQRPLVDYAPRWLASRITLPARLDVRGWCWAAVSVVIGALTHVIWDTFTHRDRWGTTHVAALQTPLLGLPAYKWFQFGSGLFGLAAIGVWLLVWLRRTPARRVRSSLTPAHRRAVWLIATAAFAVAVVVSYAVASAGSASTEAVAFAVATDAIGAAMGVGLLLCLAWMLVGRREV